MNEITKELLEALKLAGSIIGHPDDSASKHIAYVIAKAEAALAEPQAAADGWIPWNGGECPINNGVWFWLRFRNGHQFGPHNGAAIWRWDHNRFLEEGDIIAYRIVKESDK